MLNLNITSMKETSPAPLYIVATPIGNRDDITLRAISILRTADFIVAEDTRHSGLLLQHLGIRAKFIALHDHNEQYKAPNLISFLKEGKSLALISDAGTPLINDPGYHLVKLCHTEGIPVIPIPGACAAIAALCAAGMPSDRFCYEGFLPAKSGARRDKLQELKIESRTLIIYESAHRIVASLEDMAAIWGKDRVITLAKELTKSWETIIQFPVNKLIDWLKADPARQKGEFVLIVSGAAAQQKAGLNTKVMQTLELLITEMSTRKAAILAAQIFDLPKNQVYKTALEIAKNKE